MSDDLFDLTPKPPGNSLRSFLRDRLAGLAAQGIYIGTSSWKYEGWCDQIYTEDRYHTHGKWSEARFNRDCLTEYAETFSTVCVDAGYYTFPTDKYIGGLASQVPEGFKFTFKVTDTITLKHFPKLPRFGDFAGKDNEFFLNARLFEDKFLGPLEPYRSKIGLLMFEFTQFQQRDYEHGKDFLDALCKFLGSLPKGWEYGVELRNRAWLGPEYFGCLRQNGVAHVFNNWSRMPTIGEQLKHEEAFTADFCGARYLLTPPATYEQSVAAYSPYREVKAANDEARQSASDLIWKLLEKKRRGYIYVNNRLEGNAPCTIEAVLRLMEQAAQTTGKSLA